MGRAQRAMLVAVAVLLCLAMGYARLHAFPSPGTERVLLATTGPDALWRFDPRKGAWARIFEVGPDRPWHAWTDSARRAVLVLSGSPSPWPQSSLTFRALDPPSGAVLLSRNTRLGAYSYDPWHVADYDSVSKSLIYVNRTDHNLVLVPAKGPARGLAYERPTPDQVGPGVWRRVTFRVWAPKLSAGGRYVAYTRFTGDAPVLSVKCLRSPASAPGRIVLPDLVISDYAWSPSGELLAAVCYSAYDTPNYLVLYDARTNVVRRLGWPTERTAIVSRIAFVGPSQVCVLAREKGSAGLQVWLADGVHRTWKRLDGRMRTERETLFAAGDGMLAYLEPTSPPGWRGLGLAVRPIMESRDAGEAVELPQGSPAQLLWLGKRGGS